MHIFVTYYLVDPRFVLRAGGLPVHSIARGTASYQRWRCARRPCTLSNSPMGASSTAVPGRRRPAVPGQPYEVDPGSGGGRLGYQDGRGRHAGAHRAQASGAVFPRPWLLRDRCGHCLLQCSHRYSKFGEACLTAACGVVVLLTQLAAGARRVQVAGGGPGRDAARRVGARAA